MRIKKQAIQYKIRWQFPIAIFFAFIFSLTTYGQVVRLQVLDRSTLKPVPYANIWVVGENGVTSGEDGFFYLKKSESSRTLKITSIGYNTASFLHNTNSPSILYLDRQIVALPEIKIAMVRKAKQKPVKLGSAAKSNFEVSVTPPYNNRSIGKKFAGNEDIQGRPITGIKFRTFNDLQTASINLQLFTLDSVKVAGIPLYNSNIIITTEAGNNKMVSVDLTPYKILFPKTGLFIAFENLLLEDNRLLLKSDGFETEIYEPRIKVEKNENSQETFYFNGSEWIQNKKFALMVELNLGIMP